MKIEVISIRLVDPNLESGLRGFADIRLDNIILKDFKIRQRHGKPVVESPHTTFKKDGQISFHDVVTLPDELRVQVYTAILTAFFREQEKKDAERQAQQ